MSPGIKLGTLRTEGHALTSNVPSLLLTLLVAVAIVDRDWNSLGKFYFLFVCFESTLVLVLLTVARSP